MYNLSAKKMFSVLTMLIILNSNACSEKSTTEQAPLQNKGEIVTPQGTPINFCVGSVITPKEGLAYYRKLLDYLGETLNRPVKYIDLTTYKDVNDQLKQEKVDAAFVCSGPYVTGHDEFGLQLLATPQVKGKTVYHSYIIVPKNSTAKNLADLRGKTFAFTDPNSNTGRLVPTYMLDKMGETPDTFFSKQVFSYAHDRSISMVNKNMVDGAAVDGLIWEYMNHFSPETTAQTKVIEKSDPYGIPPVVVRPGLDADTKQKIKNVLLTMHYDPKGKDILDKMLIEKFVPVDDKNYDSIREIDKFIKSKGKK